MERIGSLLIANLFNIVDGKGEDLTTAETVTLLNDMCIFVPGNLYDKRLKWKEIDSHSCEVIIENGKYKVSAPYVLKQFINLNYRLERG